MFIHDRSQLFRELKLCKQLLRPLDDQRTAGSQESSQMIRGYSRQTGSCVSSLSNGIGQSLEPDAEAFLHTNLPFSAPMPRQIFYSQNSSLPSKSNLLHIQHALKVVFNLYLNHFKLFVALKK